MRPCGSKPKSSYHRCRLCASQGYPHPGYESVHCVQAPTITDAAFFHLEGIHTLDTSGCMQTTISDAAFAHLAGIHTLDMRACTQATITDAAFAHIRGLHSLGLIGCNQATITMPPLLISRASSQLPDSMLVRRAASYELVHATTRNNLYPSRGYPHA